MKGFPHHNAVGKLIAELGPEKFLEIVGEQFADFGGQVRMKQPHRARQQQYQWEMIGENLRGLASSARRAGLVFPFEIDNEGRMKTFNGESPVWKL